MIQCHSLVGLLNKRVLPLDEPPTDSPVIEPWLHKLKLTPVLSKEEGLLQASEGRIRLEEHEFRNIRVQFVPADGKDVQFIAKEHRIEHAAGNIADSPAMELAEVLHGDILVIVVGDILERPRRGFPERAKEVGDLLAMQVDADNKGRDDQEEKDYGSEIRIPGGAPEL